MALYRVSTVMTISVFADVEASSPRAAKDKASDLPVRSLCHQCASDVPNEWNTSGELDGTPDENEMVVEKIS